MKRITLLLSMFVAVTAFAQKPVKPNNGKALKSFKDGKLDEAKSMIDLATTYEKTMNDPDTWYYRGLIYSAIDTSKVEAYKSLDPEPLKKAVESFQKADQLGKPGKELFITAPDGVRPEMKSVQIENLANYYLQQGLAKLQDEDDAEAAIKYVGKTTYIFENAMKSYANDTLSYFVLGLANNSAEHYDEAIANMDKYIAKGGKSKDAYIVLYQIYNGPKESKEKALETVQKAKAVHPTNPDFPKLEIGLLIDMNKINDAKAGLEAQVKKEPNNEVFHFYLGYVNTQLGNVDAARANFNDALRVKPSYFEAQYYLANTYLIDVDKTTKEINNLGISAADNKKKPALVQKRVKEAETALPYLEKAQKLKIPNKDSEIELLHKLNQLYYFIATPAADAAAERTAKRLKELGEE